MQCLSTFQRSKFFYKDISCSLDPGGGVRVSYEYDEESEDDLRREEGISFPPDPGPLGASGRSISLDPGALAGKNIIIHTQKRITYLHGLSVFTYILEIKDIARDLKSIHYQK